MGEGGVKTGWSWSSNVCECEVASILWTPQLFLIGIGIGIRYIPGLKIVIPGLRIPILGKKNSANYSNVENSQELTDFLAKPLHFLDILMHKFRYFMRNFSEI